MGMGRWKPEEWKSYSTKTKTKRTEEIFTSTILIDGLNPKGVKVRESRDSENNPESTAIIVACDVTASMGIISDNLVRKGIGVLFEEILDRKPITDPHLMIMGVGDATMYDTAPLQVSQFETDMTITKWLEQIYIEKGGGGNGFESYDLPMYFAANHTSIDCFEKRGKKGYLFILGDEDAPPCTTKASVERFIGDDGLEADIPFNQVVEAARKMYHVYHVVVAEGHHASSYGPDKVRRRWTEHLGQNVVLLTDHSKLSEVIVSVIEVNEGRDKEEVAKSWSGDTSLVVSTAVKDLTSNGGDFDDAMDVVRL